MHGTWGTTRTIVICANVLFSISKNLQGDEEEGETGSESDSNDLPPSKSDQRPDARQKGRRCRNRILLAITGRGAPFYPSQCEGRERITIHQSKTVPGRGRGVPGAESENGGGEGTRKPKNWYSNTKTVGEDIRKHVVRGTDQPGV